ncbi:ABC transporter ATP-binding protein [Deferribacter autotrophicus]|uniref:ABC transporter ATP-binding protein n=1 Tax=Deferribacter autotrophicus TaxID=500465 RepID=A0A5A8F6B0_9BACT|nr:ABC transporter ATP-binding protein [Deferribacter autotrophicus]KAA0257158.1 ABC transporter ATP-binding protein [Deferribacter autotrophicus]
MSFIEGKELVKIYKGSDYEHTALKGVSFKIDAGDFVAIVGPSGSGKSTLLSIIGSLNPPTSGVLKIDDIDIYKLSNEKRADFRSHYLGFVFQQYNLISYLTAIENVMLPLSIKKISHSKQREMALAALEKVGLREKAGRMPSELSGGEQQRVAIARAIVHEPPLILADEPTGNLDTKNSEEIMKVFSSLNKEGLTILFVTHNIENLSFARKVIYMRDGLIENIEYSTNVDIEFCAVSSC